MTLYYLKNGILGDEDSKECDKLTVEYLGEIQYTVNALNPTITAPDSLEYS